MSGLINKYDLFIFDWDGTIVQIRILNKLNEIFNPLWRRKKRNAIITPAKLKSIEQNELKNEQHLKFFLDLFTYLIHAPLQESSIDMLHVLLKNKKNATVFTNGAEWRIKREIVALGAQKFFKDTISAQTIGKLKPNPTGLSYIINKSKTKKSRCLYIGDMADDILTAKNAGIDSCAISAGFDSYEVLLSEKPTYIFRNMREFKNALSRYP